MSFARGFITVKFIFALRSKTLQYLFSPHIFEKENHLRTRQGGYLGQFLLGVCNWLLKTPTPLKCIVLPIDFRDPINLDTFYASTL